MTLPPSPPTPPPPSSPSSELVPSALPGASGLPPPAPKREMRGLMLAAIGATVLCVLAVVAYNMTASRELTSDPTAQQLNQAARPPVSVPKADNSPGLTDLPPSPASAIGGDDEGALAPVPVPVPAPTPDPGAGRMAPGLAPATFQPPGAGDIPNTPMGEVIRRGEQIFLNTGANAPGFVGNALNCVNCYLDAGRKAHSAPLWGAYPLYPAYRSKTQHVDTFAERLRGCFVYSMNGKAPPEGDDVLVALEAYAFWMAKGAPVGEALPGAGYGKLAKPAKAPDLQRGQTVYTANCVLCHGADGQGQHSGETQVFPPLWGDRSYNWGAGMHAIDKAAAFIQANMPLGRGGTLSVQDAWDVAAFVNGHERPQDPRFTESVEATRAKFHGPPNSLYGTTVNGKLLGSGK